MEYRQQAVETSRTQPKDEKWIFIWIVVALALILVLPLWVENGYGPAEMWSWARSHFKSDHRQVMEIVSDSPRDWQPGEVRICQKAIDTNGKPTYEGTRRPNDENVLVCGFLMNYRTKASFAITFKESAHNIGLWECTKTENGIICK